LSYPIFLSALLIVPVVALLFLYSQRGRRSAAARLFGVDIRKRLMPPQIFGRMFFVVSLKLVALTLLIIAMARPQYGEQIEETTLRGADVFVVLDVSRSMQATDLPPNRLSRAKSNIRDLLSRLHGERAGLIVFAGKAVTCVPLTGDFAFFEEVLEKVDTNTVPVGGTAISDAIRQATRSMTDTPDRKCVIILITDGEDHDSLPLAAAHEAASKGIRLLLIGIGDKNTGSRIPTKDNDGRTRFMMYDNQEVWSKADEKLLSDIARETGSVYIPAGTKAFDLGEIYERHRVNTGELNTERHTRPNEQFQWFAGAGLICMFFALFIRV
jgi:Ca-activated chloride channel family protein